MRALPLPSRGTQAQRIDCHVDAFTHALLWSMRYTLRRYVLNQSLLHLEGNSNGEVPKECYSVTLPKPINI